WLDLAGHANGFIRLSYKFGADAVGNVGGLPALVVKSGFVPAWQLAPSVIDFAVQNVGGAYRAFACDSPGAVGGNCLFGSMSKFYVELCQESRVISVDVSRLLYQRLSEPDSTRVPSIAEHSSETVFTRLQKRSHIICLVLGSLKIIGELRREELIADT